MFRSIVVLGVVLNFAVSAQAEDFTHSSRISGIVLYPQGASVEREVTFEIPEGSHRLIIDDLPLTTPVETIRAETDAGRLIGLSSRVAFVPPRNSDETQQIEEAKATVDKLTDELRQAEQYVAAIRLEADAAKAQTDFLRDLAKNPGLAEMGPDQMQGLLDMVGAQVLHFLQAAQEAATRADVQDRSLKELREELQRATQTYKALKNERDERALVSLNIVADSDISGTATLTYQIDAAAWMPTYDFRLDMETQQLLIGRGALVSQQTGENWSDVDIALSTRRPSNQTAPSDIWPDIRRIFDENFVGAKRVMATADMSEMVVAEATPVVAAPELDPWGLSVTYRPVAPVNVGTGADGVRIALDDVRSDATLHARAVPLSDDRAYLVAEIVNESQEPLLATAESSFYLNGRFVGTRGTGMIAAGDETELSFGPIDGLLLERRVKDHMEGDRGLIRKSNELTESVEITARNLTGRSWPLQLLDRVPVSEQEDFTVNWSANPDPTAQEFQDKPGVMVWEQEIAPEQELKIQLDYDLRWPEDKVLR